jgi:uncharacterized protein (TIGR02270 family)
MTDRLYYTDSYLTTFQARVVEKSADGGTVYLDRTAFYPTSGGQPFDTGSIAGAPVVDVVDEGERIAHVLGAAVDLDDVECRIDWPRRFDHMQQHSGQHLLSAVMAELFGIATLSVHFGAASSTLDLDTPSLTADQVRAAETRANEAVFENLPVSVLFADSPEDLGLRKASDRSGVLRVISIEGLDRSACGGTHVRATGEIGPVLIRKLDKVRGAVRVEFLCGLRALRRAPDPTFAQFVEGPLGSPYVAIRDTAIETGMVLGMRAAWKACSKLVARNAIGAKLPLALLALGGETVDMKAVIKRLDVETMRRDALWALGFAGTVEAAEAVLGLIGDDELGQVAGESFATITGVPLVGALVNVGETDNTAPPEIDEDEDAPLPVVKPEDDLRVPNAERVRAWWEKSKAGATFQPEVRYLYGQPATPESLRSAIAAGPTWRRRVWCLEVAMRGGFDLDGRAWARKQQQADRGFPEGLRVGRDLTKLGAS